MWLITPVGFFSIVRKPDDVADDTLTIRSRVESDLEALWEKYLPSLSEIAENTGTDYRFRAKAPRSDVTKALAKIVQDLNYENFKDEVGRNQGKDRARAYEKVWSALYGLQRSAERRGATKGLRFPASSLFEPLPDSMGLRGDPFLWRAMMRLLRKTPLPRTEEELVSLIEASFEKLTGARLPEYCASEQEFVFVERFAHGGMSSGSVSFDFWRQSAIPLLCSNYRAIQRSQSRTQERAS
jgi:hypothetical protein